MRALLDISQVAKPLTASTGFRRLQQRRKGEQTWSEDFVSVAAFTTDNECNDPEKPTVCSSELKATRRGVEDRVYIAGRRRDRDDNQDEDGSRLALPD